MSNKFKADLKKLQLIGVDSKAPISSTLKEVKAKPTKASKSVKSETRTKVKCYIHKGVIPNTNIALAQIQYTLWDYLEDVEAFCKETFSSYEIREFKTLKTLIKKDEKSSNDNQE